MHQFTSLDDVQVYGRNPDKLLGDCIASYAALQIEKNTGRDAGQILEIFAAGGTVRTPDFTYVPNRPADDKTPDPVDLLYRSA